jgi:hypothetical protein
MMEDVLVKFNVEMLWFKLHSTRKGLFLLAHWTRKLRKKLVKNTIWGMALYGAETWTLNSVDQKHLKSFKMWCL